MSKKLFWWGCFKVLPGWWLNLPTSCYLWWQPSPPPSSQFPNDGRDSASLGDCQGFQGTPNFRQGAWSNRVGQAHLDELHRGLTKCRDLWGRLFLHVSIEMSDTLTRAFAERWNYPTNTRMTGDREITPTLLEIRELTGLPI